MGSAGGFQWAQEIVSWIWRVLPVIFVFIIIKIAVLSYINLHDDTKEILADSFVVRAKSCIKEDKDLNQCFKNSGTWYDIKVIKEGDVDKKLMECTKCVHKERKFYINSEKYNLEVVYHA